MNLRCSHRLPSPEIAGRCDIIDRETGRMIKTGWELIKEDAAMYQHLRPCPQKKWNRVNRKRCEKCQEAVLDPETPATGAA